MLKENPSKVSLFKNGVEIARFTGTDVSNAEFLIDAGEALKKVEYVEFRNYISSLAFCYIRTQNQEMINDYNKFCNIAL